MHHHSGKHLYFGLVATTLAGAFGCNSHLLVQAGNPEVVVIDNPVINSPFAEPRRHFRFADTGITSEIDPGRRGSCFI